MRKLMDALVDRLEQGKKSVLVTIVQTTGSAPRTVGAAMLVGEEGYILGTIGGGMLEFKATQQAVEDLKAEKSTMRAYRLTRDEVAGLGMVCGGDVDVLFKVILPGEEKLETAVQILECMQQYRKGWLVQSLSGEDFGFVNDAGIAWGIAEEKLPSLKTVGSERAFVAENDAGERFYLCDLENTSRVFVFGGGHLAQELVPLLSHLGFRCIVTDDREEFSTKELFPTAEEVHTRDFNCLAGQYDIHEQDYIVAVTRGHMGDLAVEKFALRTPAYYIGVVGSKRKIEAVNAKLREAGFTEEDLARVVNPIGLSIQSETPAEIAVSIAAQLIERRANYKKNVSVKVLDRYE